MPDSTAFLRQIWYFALPSAQLKPGAMMPLTLLEEPVVFGRDRNGRAFALRDICPHRAVPLSCGKFDGCEIECCYHGWRFDAAGNCTQIPALTGGESINVEKIRVRSYTLHEAQGCIWIFMGKVPGEGLPDPPSLPDVADAMRPFLVERLDFPCFIDHAVVGLMDPAHGPFVHQSWWWRTRRSVHDKVKQFAPSQHGFTMVRHQPSSNSFAYKILGGRPETEISFRLPGIRVEDIRVGREQVVNLTAVTPIDANTTSITHMIYATLAWAPLLKPILRVFARRFLEQDKAVVVMQQAGLKHEQNLLLIRDADTQARWYYQLKAEFQRAQAEARAFENPVKPATLRWRS